MRPLLLAVLLVPAVASAADRKVPCDFTAERGVCLFSGERVSGGTPLAVEGIAIEEGALQFGIGSALRVGTGSLDVARGWFSLSTKAGAARLAGGKLVFRDASLFSVPDANLSIIGARLAFAEASRMRVEGGNLALDGASALDLSGSSLDVGGGSFTVSGGSTFSTRDSTMTVTGGNLLFLKGGDVRFDGNSTMTLSSGSLEVGDGSMFRLGGGSSISVTGGNVVFSGKSTVGFDDGSAFAVNGGNLRLSGALGFGRGASMRATRVDVLADGRVDFRAGSALVFDGSRLMLGLGATLVVAEDAVVSGSGAVLSTPDGALSFESLARLDAACAGDAIVSVSREGKTSLACEVPCGEWKCQDPCLRSEDGLVCGSTDHL